MLAIERRNAIKKFLVEAGIVSVSELCQYLNVSESTIRRDLDILDKENVLKKIHGGAVIVDDMAEPLFREREHDQVIEKDEIAKFAVSLISDGETVLLDSSTSTAAMVKYLKERKGITVVTNSISISNTLLDYPDIQVVVTGGYLRHRTGSLIGSNAVESLKGIWVDKAFISCSGICPYGGVTVTNLVTIEVRKQMVASAKQIFILADHTKLEKRCLARFASIKDIDFLITDHLISDKQRQEFINAGAEVLIPDQQRLLKRGVQVD